MKSLPRIGRDHFLRDAHHRKELRLRRDLLQVLRIGRAIQPPAHRVLAGPEALGQPLVDDCHRASLRPCRWRRNERPLTIGIFIVSK